MDPGFDSLGSMPYRQAPIKIPPPPPLQSVNKRARLLVWQNHKKEILIATVVALAAFVAHVWFVNFQGPRNAVDMMLFFIMMFDMTVPLLVVAAYFDAVYYYKMKIVYS